MAAQWYFARDRKKHGPVPIEHLKEMVKSQALNSTDMVMEEGADKWVLAASVAGLFGVTPNGVAVAVPVEEAILVGTIVQEDMTGDPAGAALETQAAAAPPTAFFHSCTRVLQSVHPLWIIGSVGGIAALLLVAIGGSLLIGSFGKSSAVSSASTSAEAVPLPIQATQTPDIKPKADSTASSDKGTTDDQAKGFVSLFNGKDLTGFIASTSLNKDSLRVADAAVICSEKAKGFFCTERSYRNYHVKCEVKYLKSKAVVHLGGDPKGAVLQGGGQHDNAGLILHLTDPNDICPSCKGPRWGIKVQLLAPDMGSLLGAHATKGTFQTDEAAQNRAMKPIGEWNVIEAISQDGSLTVLVNGAKVSEGRSSVTGGRVGWQLGNSELHIRTISIRSADSVPVTAIIANAKGPNGEAVLQRVNDDKSEQGYQKADGSFVKHGKTTAYYDAARTQLKSEWVYKNGKRDGHYKEWHKNGNIAIEGQFADDQQELVWLSHYQAGGKEWEITYLRGVKNGPAKRFFPPGYGTRVERSEFYLDGKLDGEQRFYDITGKVHQVVEWKRGVVGDVTNFR